MIVGPPRSGAATGGDNVPQNARPRTPRRGCLRSPAPSTVVMGAHSVLDRRDLAGAYRQLWMPFQPARGLLVEGRVPMRSAGRDKFLARPLPRHRTHRSDSYRPRDDRSVAHRTPGVRFALHWLPKARPESLHHAIILHVSERGVQRRAADMYVDARSRKVVCSRSRASSTGSSVPRAAHDERRGVTERSFFPGGLLDQVVGQLGLSPLDSGCEGCDHGVDSSRGIRGACDAGRTHHLV